MRSINQNSERALFPVSAIRQILVGDPEPAPPEAEVATWDRAAFHFIDGPGAARIDPLRRASRSIRRRVAHRRARIGTELRTIAVPYAALKGVYQIRQWDSRPAERARRARRARSARARARGARADHRRRRHRPDPATAAVADATPAGFGLISDLSRVCRRRRTASDLVLPSRAVTTTLVRGEPEVSEAPPSLTSRLLTPKTIASLGIAVVIVGVAMWRAPDRLGRGLGQHPPRQSLPLPRGARGLLRVVRGALDPLARAPQERRRGSPVRDRWSAS